jgi:hypothetical protein
MGEEVLRLKVMPMPNNGRGGVEVEGWTMYPLFVTTKFFLNHKHKFQNSQELYQARQMTNEEQLNQN